MGSNHGQEASGPRVGQLALFGLALMICWPVIPLLVVGGPIAAAIGPGRKRGRGGR